MQVQFAVDVQLVPRLLVDGDGWAARLTRVDELADAAALFVDRVRRRLAELVAQASQDLTVIVRDCAHVSLPFPVRVPAEISIPSIQLVSRNPVSRNLVVLRLMRNRRTREASGQPLDSTTSPS